MHAAGAVAAVPGTAVISQLVECVLELAGIAGDGCLVEGPDGRLLAHHLYGTDIDPLLLSTVVSGSLGGLQAALTSRRTTGLLPSGPVVEASLAGRSVVQVALRGGAIWLLTTRPVPLEALSEPVERLAALLACTTGAAEPSCLEGGRLPGELTGSERLWVARVTAEVPVEVLRGSLAPTLGPVVLRPVSCAGAVYLIASASRRATSPHTVRLAVQKACEAAADRLGTPVTAGLSALCDPGSLPTARRQADATASAAEPGTCAALDEVRAALVLRRLAEHLPSGAELGPDPLQRLLDYDTKRDTDFTDSLLAWLNTCGDVARAAAALALHANTLRYRLRRIMEILEVDLQEDAACRAVVHLQLLGRTTR